MTAKATNNGQLVEPDCEDVVSHHAGISSSNGPCLEVLSEEERESPSDGRGELDDQELKRIVEAVLFVSHEPVTVDKLMITVRGVAKSQVVQALRALQSDYDHEDRGLRIAEVAGGFKMVTHQDCGIYIRRLSKAKSSSKLSLSALETLAIVSYKQPIIRSDIEKMRGVETSGVLRTLLDQKLVRIVGRQDVPGRPILYGTSKQFLQRFGLRDLRDLPPLKEIRDLGPSATLDLPFAEEQPSGEPPAEGIVDLPA